MSISRGFRDRHAVSVLLIAICLAIPSPARAFGSGERVRDATPREPAPARIAESRPLARAEAQVPQVSYRVLVRDPHQHVFQVLMRIERPGTGSLDVSMPVWTPGSYLIREFERQVVRFAAHGPDEAPLAWRKIDKNTWRIETGGADGLEVSYDVYAREPGIRWSFLYSEGGHVLGPNLFMYVVGSEGRPVSARFDLPDGWRLTGGIAPPVDDPFTIQASSYHQLIDTPMLIGRFDDIEFEVNGVPHVIAFLGPHNADLERVRDDVSRIVEAGSDMFDGLPYDRYAFIYLTITGGGGIEHENGTTIGLGNMDLSGGGHRGLLGVSSHEFFHAWNVKRIQPPAFRPYDYEEENYTDALWFYEGFTSFYGERLLLRAGLIQGLGNPVGMVNQYRSVPGHDVQSPADASYNAWIHLYRGDESFDNYRTNYYAVGNILANLLTLEIAQRSGGEQSLDDVMRWIWQRTRDAGAAFDSRDIQAACETVVGGSFQEFFDRYVFGTGPIPFERYFRMAGYELRVDEAATAAMNRTGYLGVSLSEAQDALFVSGVVRDGPAWRDGLSYGDVILTVNGTSARGMEAFREVIGPLPPGTPVEIRIRRYAEEKTITVTLGERPAPVYTLVEVENPTELQLAVRRRWSESS